MNVQLTDGMVKFEYIVDNTNGDGTLPFGLAFHPWFLYQGTRADTFLTVPAPGRMEVDNGNPPELLPTGKVQDVTGTKYDCRAGRSLENWVVDDVFIGMTPDKPAVIDFRDKGRKSPSRRATPLRTWWSTLRKISPGSASKIRPVRPMPTTCMRRG
ncbi:MAG: hypothetical protein U0903_02790 [Planctomycetales bacterium]